MRSLKVFLVAVCALLLLAPMASATPLTVTWKGGLFGLEMISANPATNTYTIQYTADFAGFDPTAQQAYLTAVAFKVGAEPTSASLVATNASGDWTVVLNKWMNNNSIGCGSNGNPQGAICAEVAVTASNFGFVPTKFKNFYYWNFQIVAPGDVTVAGQPIRADFVDALGRSANQLSLTTPTEVVPEPATMLLLGTGLLGLGLFLHRR